MGQLLLFLVAALVVAAIVFGVTVMVSGGDTGLTPVEPDGRAVPLPSDRPLGEEDIVATKFDTAFRGYRMAQVDQALQRAAYDIGYKGELIGVLEAEVAALRDGRIEDADVLRRAREAAVAPPPADPPGPEESRARSGDNPMAMVADVPPSAAGSSAAGMPPHGPAVPGPLASSSVAQPPVASSLSSGSGGTAAAGDGATPVAAPDPAAEPASAASPAAGPAVAPASVAGPASAGGPASVAGPASAGGPASVAGPASAGGPASVAGPASAGGPASGVGPASAGGPGPAAGSGKPGPDRAEPHSGKSNGSKDSEPVERR